MDIKKFGVYAVPAWRFLVLLLLAAILFEQHEIRDSIPNPDCASVDDVTSAVQGGVDDVKKKLKGKITYTDLHG